MIVEMARVEMMWKLDDWEVFKREIFDFGCKVWDEIINMPFPDVMKLFESDKDAKSAVPAKP